MKQIKEVEGDLISLFQQGEFDVIVHGCNCQNIMGAGIALSLAEAYPELMKVDSIYSTPIGHIDRLGNYSKLIIGEDVKTRQYIINAYTQFNPGKDLDYNALELVLKKINFQFKPERIGINTIGCGIAGGNWNVVKKIIERQLRDCDVTVVHYKP